MATGEKKVKSKWDADTERQLIGIWADILEEYGGKMIPRKEEAIVTTRINIHLTQKLGRTEQYMEKAEKGKANVYQPPKERRNKEGILSG